MKKLIMMLTIALMIWSCDSKNPSSVDNGDIDSLEEPVTLAKRGKGSVKVMTWNVYVGTDVDIILGASDPQQIPVLAAQAFQGLLATNFSERADAIAKQVKKHKPDLIGLQEVSLLRIQSPGDLIVGGTSPAETVLFDYQDILMDALAELGLRYYVAGVVENADVELPMLTGVDPQPTFDDIRLTDYDIVLARRGVKVSDVKEVNYQTNLSIPGLGLEVTRGYVSLEARVHGKKFRFVNTHLETAGITDAFQQAQAAELFGSLANESKTVILVGDLNTRPGDATYDLFGSQGFEDLWLLNSRHDDPDGYTSSHSADLLSQDPLFQRIDYIMMNPHKNTRIKVKATVIGDKEADKTVNGLWPSDHAGVVAEIKLK